MISNENRIKLEISKISRKIPKHLKFKQHNYKQCIVQKEFTGEIRNISNKVTKNVSKFVGCS